MIAKLLNLVYVFFHKFLTAFILPYLGLFNVDFKSPENKRRHVIMITGCDTGFGYLSAKKLIAQGFTGILNPLLMSCAMERIFLLQLQTHLKESIASYLFR
jgi:hypothetical protein